MQISLSSWSFDFTNCRVLCVNSFWLLHYTIKSLFLQKKIVERYAQLGLHSDLNYIQTLFHLRTKTYSRDFCYPKKLGLIINIFHGNAYNGRNPFTSVISTYLFLELLKYTLDTFVTEMAGIFQGFLLLLLFYNVASTSIHVQLVPSGK